MATQVPCIKNGAAGFTFGIGLIDQSNTKLLKASPTLAAGDFKISIDGGAFANLTTLPTVTPAAGRQVQIVLSQGETNGDNLFIQWVDAAGAEWCDGCINIQTTARHLDDLAFPATSGRSLAVDSAGGVTLADAVSHGGTLGSSTATLALKQINVTNSASTAMVLSSTGGNGAGLAASGNGSGHGISGTGGNTGNGIRGIGGATSGSGITGAGSASGANGIQAAGNGTGAGFRGIGGATGAGIAAQGGATSGDGLVASVTSGAEIRGTITGGVTGTLGDLDTATVGTYTIRQLVRGLASALLGKLSGAATTTNTFRSADDAKDVITATVDSSGNRSAVTLDLT